MNSKIILKPPKAHHGISSPTVAYAIVVSLLLIIVAAALLVLFYLPRHVATQRTTLSENKAVETNPAIAEEKTTLKSITTKKSVITLPTAAKSNNANQTQQNPEREQASLALQDYLRTKSNPLLDQAHIWAVDQWQSSQQLAKQADQTLRTQKYQLAAQAYTEANSILTSLIEQRPEILKMRLQQAQEDLLANRIEPAIDGFNQVLAMDAGHSQAQNGLARANVREQVLKLITQAQNALAKNELQVALTHYKNVLKLDKQYPQIEQIVTALSQQIKQIQFDEFIASASEFLRLGALDDAQEAVNSAVSVIPNDNRAKALQDEIDRRKLTKIFNETMQQADRHRRHEQWQNAVDKYNQALSLKPAADKTKTALAFAQQRLILHNTLDKIIADPASLFNKSSLNQAEQLMATIATMSYQGETALENKTKNLNELITQAKIPLLLSLISDALTEVVIYPAAKLGSFQKKNLKLRPGSYVITGTRAGFRDVRKSIKLTPGSPIPHIEIKCSEKI